MDVEVSFIVPVYNIKKEFLLKCLNSLCNQSFENFEIVIVNDGSDNAETLECLNEFEKNNAHVIVLHQQNSGVSIARNNGFNNSTGSYICFIDPDDWVTENYAEELIYALKCNNADFVMADCFCAYSDRIVENRFLDGAERDLIGDEKNEILYQLIGKKICKYYPPEIAAGVVWGKMFKRSFIKKCGLEFILGMVRMQDNIYCLYAIEKADKIHYLPKKLYYYRKDEGSACFKYSPNIVTYFEKYFDETLIFLNEFKKEAVLYDALNMKELTSFNSFFSRYFFHSSNKKSKKATNKEIKELLRNERYGKDLKNINYSILTFEEKVFVFLLKNKMLSILRFLIKIRGKHKI